MTERSWSLTLDIDANDKARVLTALDEVRRIIEQRYPDDDQLKQDFSKYTGATSVTNTVQSHQLVLDYTLVTHIMGPGRAG